jgi:hypothetical protein
VKILAELNCLDSSWFTLNPEKVNRKTPVSSGSIVPMVKPNSTEATDGVDGVEDEDEAALLVFTKEESYLFEGIDSAFQDKNWRALDRLC